LNAVVLGAEGQLGSELVRLLPGTGMSVPIHEPARIEDVFQEHHPDVVFNCAAYNHVDQAEAEPDAARESNVIGPRVIADACRRHGALFVHYSTNFVFDGLLDHDYLESDEPAPLSVYGASKLAGEAEVFSSGVRGLVIRTAAVYGGPQSFPRRILRRAAGEDRIQVVSDQRVNPTYARDLANASIELVDHGVAGIVHVVGGGCCGWDEFARAVLDEVGVDTEVEPVPSSAFPTPARRPRNGCLGTARYRPLRPWREALHEWALEAKEA
jgi:dTDP-4-dehydrorhamnose reductase